MIQDRAFTKRLYEKVENNENSKISLKARRLLKGFGYYKRTKNVIACISSALRNEGLESDISLENPTDLDERIAVWKVVSSPAPKEKGMTYSKEIGSSQKREQNAEKTIKAAVRVLTDIGQGSGFIVHPNGLVVTARHVVDDRNGQSYRRVKIVLEDDTHLDGIVVRSHPLLDYALVWTQKDREYPVLPIGNPNALRFGQSAIVVGAPGDFARSVSAGIISNPCQEYRRIECIQTDAAIYFGNSGGPLVVEDGVVGVVVWGEEADQLKFAVPLDYFIDDIRTIEQLGKENSIIAQYCPECGFLDSAEKTWFCRNCGYDISRHRFAQVKPEKEKVQSLEELIAICTPHTKDIFVFMIEIWQQAGFTIRPVIGGISLLIKEDKLVPVATLRPETKGVQAIVFIGWSSMNNSDLFPADSFERFQTSISSLFELGKIGNSARIEVNDKFDKDQARSMAETFIGLARSIKE